MDEEIIKSSPNNIEAEKSVIGSMIMDMDAITAASEILTSEDFYYNQYGVMFDAMIELMNEGKPVDVVTLQEKLSEKGVPEAVGGLNVLKELVLALPTSANIRHYAAIVRDKAVLRRVITATEEISRECYLGKDSVEDILADTEKKVFNLVQNRGSGEFVPIKSVALDALKGISRAYQNKGNITGIPTGFTDLDYKLSGLQPSDLILIAAR
ncbi:MAG: replicative DNA helicase, partial [Alistipes sp.]|nr:replicative DNA helicase [Alistipes sp.]